MKPGVYDIEHEKYLKMNGLSKSGLSNFSKSPEEYQYKRMHPVEQTKAMRNGTIIHTATLEPSRYREEYAVAPSVDRRTKVGKAKLQAFVEMNPGKEIIAQEEHDLAVNISAAVHNSKKAHEKLSNARIESSVFWNDPDYDFLCKARPDALDESTGTIIDLKTTNDATYNKARNTIMNLKYHWQAAFYLRGMRILEPGKYTNFMFVFVETTPPYYINNIVLSPDFITMAEIEISTLLGDYARCLESDIWPGPPDEITEMEPPEYYRRKFENNELPF